MKKFIASLILIAMTSYSHAQWFTLNSGTTTNLNGLCVVDSLIVYAVGDNGIILKTIDGGYNWSQQNPVSYQLLSVSFCDQNTGMAVGVGGIVLKTTDGGNVWFPLNSGTIYSLEGVWFQSPDKITILQGEKRYMISNNGGTTWQVNTPYGYPWSFYFNDMAYTNWGPRRGIFSAHGFNNEHWYYIRVVFISSDGSYWPSYQENTSQYFEQVSVLPSGTVFAYEGSTKSLMRSQTGFGGWFVRGYIGYGINDLFFVNENSGTALKNDGIYHTSDGGWVWDKISPLVLKSVAFADTNIGYAVGNGGAIAKIIHYVPVELTSFIAEASNNEVLLQWTTASELNNSGFEIERKNNDAWRTIKFVSGHGTTSETQNYFYSDNVSELDNGSVVSYRLKQIDFDGSFEYSNEIELIINLISGFSLSQNYPNPFNPSTIIKYSVASSSFVTLNVYDVLGNEIAALVNEEKQPGIYTAEFNGAGLSSGVYFYRLIAGDRTDIKKMIMMK